MSGRSSSVVILYDASGNAVAVKGASATPVASDNALVVSLSPNSAPIGVSTAPANSNSGLAVGYITTSSTTDVPIRSTTYTEQAADAQRSIASSSASDTAAGTGARTVKITYYDSTGAGPFTETVTLNGTTAVATASSTICFIEKMEVMTVGSTGSNVGTLTLFVNNAGGGGTIGTIAATINRTFWAHHYVPTGKTTYVTAVTGHNNNNSNATTLSLRAKPIGGTAPEQVIGSYVRVAGSSSIQSSLDYNQAIFAVGPARVILYGAPESNPAIITRAAFAFYDV